MLLRLISKYHIRCLSDASDTKSQIFTNISQKIYRKDTSTETSVRSVEPKHQAFRTVWPSWAAL